MKFFTDLERKYHKYAIPNLMYYIIALYSAGLVLHWTQPELYWQLLCLDAEAILHGQVWRLVTFLIYPPALGSWVFLDPVIGVLSLLMYFNLGQTLERIWGAFRFNLFFLIGVIGQILAVLVAYLVFKQRLILDTGYLNSSIFLAFAFLYPDAVFRLFFVLPVSAKILAFVECAIYVYEFIKGNTSTRVAIVISLANVIVFFLMTRNYKRFAPKEIKRRKDFKKGAKILPKGKTRHQCAVCGRTELDGADLEFRYCSKCTGSYEYCQDHLYTHQHVEKEPGQITKIN